LIGKNLAHYEILEKIGTGGMGVVYRAQDTRLGRHVALKFLLEGTSRDTQAIERFRREARAASSLNHPGICTIHDIGDHEGQPFIVMELLEGRSLRERLSEEKLSFEQVLDLALQISGALVAAHGKGLVHRDIKPDNIFITDGNHAKILDFGLVKLIQPEADTIAPDDSTKILEPTLTGECATLGTIAYMSPEQALGREVDARTDVFSLGAVLHEMCNGGRAFPGKTAAAIIDAILNRAPADPSGEAATSPGMQQIINKALEKNPGLRYGSAADLHTDLKRLQRDVTGSPDLASSGAASVDESRTLVVLPFNILAGDAEDEFLRLALAEAVSHGLSRNRELVVRPTSAVLKYMEQDANPSQVARELNATVVIEGTIQKLGSNVRVQVQGWDAPKETTILSVKIDGHMNDLFGLQDELAEELSRSLGVDDSDRSTPEPRTQNPRAYELFLRGNERLLRYTKWDTSSAIEMFRRCVELDPGFSSGWARLALACVHMGIMIDPDPKWFEEAGHAVDRALALDPNDPEVWTARGRLLWSPHHGFQHEVALRDLNRACDHPCCPSDAVLWRAVILGHVGLHDEAIKYLDQVLEDQPDDMLGLLVMGETIGWKGDSVAALEFMKQTVDRDPTHIYANLFLPMSYLYAGEENEAEGAITKAREFTGQDSMLTVTEAMLWAKRGETQRATETLEAALEHRQSLSHNHHTSHFAAAVLATLGDESRAVKELTRAADDGMPNYPAFLQDRHLAPLRGREDFHKLMGELKVRWKSFSAEFGEA
jgi:non-specific serine/threonine protein kinase